VDDDEAIQVKDVFLCDAIRTPIGRFGGALSGVRTDDLAAIPIRALHERYGNANWSTMDDVILGRANQAGELNRNVARMVALLSGTPVTVPGVTVNGLCGSGLKTVAMAARATATGEADLVISGGVQSMSRAPYVISKSATPFARDAQMFDTTIGWRFVNAALRAPRTHESAI
jgi:acetyl-CoA acetyltransferase